MEVKRDWGHARDYVEMMWMMLQQEVPEDFVIATGEQYSLREFVNLAAEEMGMNLTWRGRGLEEQAFDGRGRCVVSVDPCYFRPSEVDSVVGDASKARTKLGWRPKTTFREIVAEMAKSDLQAAEHERAVMNTMIYVQE
jgi:GDPmannose 4,6-dehydratase